MNNNDINNEEVILRKNNQITEIFKNTLNYLYELTGGELLSTTEPEQFGKFCRLMDKVYPDEYQFLPVKCDEVISVSYDDAFDFIIIEGRCNLPETSRFVSHITSKKITSIIPTKIFNYAKEDDMIDDILDICKQKLLTYINSEQENETDLIKKTSLEKLSKLVSTLYTE